MTNLYFVIRNERISVAQTFKGLRSIFFFEQIHLFIILNLIIRFEIKKEP